MIRIVIAFFISFGIPQGSWGIGDVLREDDRPAVSDLKCVQSMLNSGDLRINEQDESVPVNVLSIDGGGVRGIIPATLCDLIEAKTGKQMYELADLVVGTSTGGIICTALTAPQEAFSPRSAKDIIQLYKDFSNKIFPNNSCFGIPYSHIGRLLHPGSYYNGFFYSAKPLEKELTKYFGDSTLRNLIKPTVITAVDVETNSPYLFKSYRSQWSYKHPGVLGDRGGDFLLRDVCRATSAAPTYFPMARIQGSFAEDLHFNAAEKYLIDGGVALNNPSFLALTEAYKIFPGRSVNLISLGTGEFVTNVHSAKEMAYPFPRAKCMPEIFMDAQSHGVHQELSNLSESQDNFNYHRLQIPLAKENMKMDDPKIIVTLEDQTRNHFSYRGRGNNNLQQVIRLFE